MTGVTRPSLSGRSLTSPRYVPVAVTLSPLTVRFTVIVANLFSDVTLSTVLSCPSIYGIELMYVVRPVILEFTSATFD